MTVLQLVHLHLLQCAAVKKDACFDRYQSHLNTKVALGCCNEMLNDLWNGGGKTPDQGLMGAEWSGGLQRNRGGGSRTLGCIKGCPRTDGFMLRRVLGESLP